MSIRGKWIYSISGDTVPGDAPEALDSRAGAVERALATYWPGEARKELRDAHAKSGGFKLKFYVGQVVQAKLCHITGDDIVRSLLEQQLPHADIPPDWPSGSAGLLGDAVARVVTGWLAGSGQTPNWDAVVYEVVEIEA